RCLVTGATLLFIACMQPSVPSYSADGAFVFGGGIIPSLASAPDIMKPATSIRQNPSRPARHRQGTSEPSRNSAFIRTLRSALEDRPLRRRHILFHLFHAYRAGANRVLSWRSYH